MQLNHGNLSTHLQGKVLAEQVNFVLRHLHSNCIGPECASAWRSFFFSFNHILWTGINIVPRESLYSRLLMLSA